MKVVLKYQINLFFKFVIIKTQLVTRYYHFVLRETLNPEHSNTTYLCLVAYWCIKLRYYLCHCWVGPIQVRLFARLNGRWAWENLFNQNLAHTKN